MSPPSLTGHRELPDFLTRGDPALTFPHGKTYTPLHPKGVPNTPTPVTDADAAREWLENVVAGRIGDRLPCR